MVGRPTITQSQIQSASAPAAVAASPGDWKVIDLSGNVAWINRYSGEIMTSSGQRMSAPQGFVPEQRPDIAPAPAIKNPFAGVKYNPYVPSGQSEPQPQINMTLPGLPDNSPSSPANFSFTPPANAWDAFWGTIFPSASSQAQAQQPQASWTDFFTGQMPAGSKYNAIDYPDAPLSINMPAPQIQQEAIPPPADAQVWSNVLSLPTFTPSIAASAAQAQIQPEGPSIWDKLSTGFGISSSRPPAINYPDAPLDAGVVPSAAPVAIQTPNYAAPAPSQSTWPSLTFSNVNSKPLDFSAFLAPSRTPQLVGNQMIMPPMPTSASSGSNMPLYIGLGVLGAALLAFAVLRK